MLRNVIYAEETHDVHHFLGFWVQDVMQNCQGVLQASPVMVFLQDVVGII